jgi:hypothetical protein
MGRFAHKELIVFVVALGVIAPACGAPVSLAAAKAAAAERLPAFFPGAWNYRTNLVYYDPDGLPAAYAMVFLRQNSAGAPDGAAPFATVVTHADDTAPAILKCHLGLPALLAKKREAEALAARLHPHTRWRVGRCLYLSPFDETCEAVPETGGLETSPVVIDLRTATSAPLAEVAAKYHSRRAVRAAAETLTGNTNAPPTSATTGEDRRNCIPGATNNLSSVPTYLNNPDMYSPRYNSGICWATCAADILGYWDRTPYNGVTCWNLIDHGIAPLLQNGLPSAPGHDQADVYSLITNLVERYYLSGEPEAAIFRTICNTQKGLAFTVTYHSRVAASDLAARTVRFSTIASEIDAGRPVAVGAYGTFFGGPHEVPAIGYIKMSNTVDSTLYIHRNTGWTESEYVNPFDPSWGDLDMDTVIPGGTPVDAYDALGDDSAATPVTLDPDNIYGFRQTHSIRATNDVDWVRLNATAGRQYTIATTHLGTNADTVLSLIATDGVTELARDDNSGDAPGASKIVWNCWNSGAYFIRVSPAATNFCGPNANYDLEVSYTTLPGGLTASNGTPKAWLEAYRLANAATNWDAAELADTDGDGLPAWREYLAGTDPTNPLSVLAVAGFAVASDGGFILQWYSVSNRVYAIERAAGLAPAGFAPIATNLAAHPPCNAHTDTVTSTGERFYRIGVTLPP